MNFFCGRERVVEEFAGKTVALVGGGPGAKQNPPGLVDSHEVVVRVNDYKLSWSGTGTRTDVFYSFFGHSIRKRQEELIKDGVRLCICKCPDAQFMESEWHASRGKHHGVDFRYIYEFRKSWWFCPTYVPTVGEFMRHFRLLGDHVPTTGFAALLEVLSCGPKVVYMTGFDFFQSGIHNLRQLWRPGHPDDPIGHDPARELEWLRQNIHKHPIETDQKLGLALQNRWTPPPRMRQMRRRWQ